MSFANDTSNSKADADLASSSDSAPWRPSNEILEIFPDAYEMEVELIEESTNLNSVNEHLVDEKRIGLVIMGTKIDRSCKPALIVLTTSVRFYAIDPEDELRGIKFLKMKLNDPQLEFWTSNCYAESDCLYHNYGIELRKLNAKSCVGLNLTLMKKMAFLSESARKVYPPGASRQCRWPLRLESFEELVRMYTYVDRYDIKFDESQLAHLKKRPLNLTAINVIKKRCILVLAVARNIIHALDNEKNRLSWTMFNRLKEVHRNPLLKPILVKQYELAVQSGKADHISFSHFVQIENC